MVSSKSDNVLVYSDAIISKDVLTMELSVVVTLTPQDRSKTISALLQEIEAVLHSECTAPMLTVARNLVAWMDTNATNASKSLPITKRQEPF